MKLVNKNTEIEIQIQNFQITVMFQTFTDFLFDVLLLLFLLKLQLYFAKLCKHPHLQLDAVRILRKFWKETSFTSILLNP